MKTYLPYTGDDENHSWSYSLNSMHYYISSTYLLTSYPTVFLIFLSELWVQCFCKLIIYHSGIAKKKKTPKQRKFYSQGTILVHNKDPIKIQAFFSCPVPAKYFANKIFIVRSWQWQERNTPVKNMSQQLNIKNQSHLLGHDMCEDSPHFYVIYNTIQNGKRY